MKRSFTIVYCLSFVIGINISLKAQQVFRTTPASVIGYLEYLPDGYHTTSEKYPVVIFLHGRGEKGPRSNNPSKLLEGVSKLTKLGPPHYALNGTKFPFILISPQLKSGYGDWPLWYIMEVLNRVKQTLRIDESRIYLTGLSLGGGGVWTAAQEQPEIFAAIAPVCGSRNSRSKAKAIAEHDLPVWAFHGDNDNVIPWSLSGKMIDAINSFGPDPRAKLTTYKGVRHEAWNNAYKPDHSIHQQNIYEWMLAQSKKKSSQQNGQNAWPLVNAGIDREIDSDEKMIELTGTASDSDGSISRYQWTKVSGGEVRMDGASSAKLVLSSFRPGLYTFRLTVTDDKGATKSDEARLTVKDHSAPSLQALAGPDRHLRLPVTNYSMSGGAISNGGYIRSYEWKQVEGDPLKLYDANTRIMKIPEVRTPGKRTFILTVTDTRGRIARDYVRLHFENGTSRNAMEIPEIVADPSTENPKPDEKLEQTWENHFVNVYNERGERIFSGIWKTEKFAQVFQQKGFYVYQTQNGGRIRSGKIVIQ